MKDTINEYLTSNSIKVNLIIQGLDAEFTSHEFIQRFAQEYEEDYIEFLYAYKKQNAFQTVHAQIARHLSIGSKSGSGIYPIEKTDDARSQNVFGAVSPNQGWKRI